MNPIIVALIAVLMVFAIKRRNGEDGLERWRFAAVLSGALFPYTDIILWFLGPGSYLQARHALFWSLPLMPLFAAVVASLVSAVVKEPVARLFPGVMSGMLLTLLLGLLTQDAIAPLALLSRIRIGLAWLHPLDPVLPGLALLGLVMVTAFRPFNRDMARLSMVCIVLYMVAGAGFAWDARRQGEAYAGAMKLGPVQVDVYPGGGSPFNWEILVAEERSGKLHLARLNLGQRTSDFDRGSSAQPAAFLPVDAAVWRVFARYGEPGVLSSEERRQIRLAWYAWRESAYAFYRQGAAFDGFVEVSGQPGKTCVRFADVRLMRKQLEASRRMVVCPVEGSPARVYQMHGEKLEELVPTFLVKQG